MQELKISQAITMREKVISGNRSKSSIDREIYCQHQCYQAKTDTPQHTTTENGKGIKEKK